MRLEHRYTTVASNYLMFAYEFNYSFIGSNLSFIKLGKRLREVAQGRRTYQSSLYDSKFPSKFAVDGRLGTIQHTKKQYHPYWVVDLGTIYNIERVEIYNEPNCCGKSIIINFKKERNLLNDQSIE